MQLKMQFDSVKNACSFSSAKSLHAIMRISVRDTEKLQKPLIEEIRKASD